MAAIGNWGDTETTLSSETERLIDLYVNSELSNAQIAVALNRSERSIANKLLNLRKKFKEEGRPLARVAVPAGGRVTGRTGETPDAIASPTGPDGIEVEEKGNTMVLTSKGSRVTTLEGLIEAAKVDLDTWLIERHIVNKWEVAGKFGSKGDEHFQLQDLWQVKAWLVRKEPIAIFPVISPVVIKVLPLTVAKSRSGLVGAKRGIVLPDPQFGFTKSLRTAKLEPFHDRTALDVALQIAQDYPLDYVCWLGDFFDLADWSDKFTRDPNFFWTTQPSAIEGKWWMTQFKMAVPEAKTILLEGNHEARLPNQLIQHMKEAFGLRSVDNLDLPPLMSIPRILALHDIEVEWIGDYPNGQSWVNDYIVCEHGDIARGQSGATVSAMVKNANETKIIGHIHRIESATRTIHEKDGPRSVAVHSVGCLCRVDGIVPGKKARNNWQQAIGMIEYYDDGRSDHTIVPVPINGGRAIYNGKLYEARDRREEIIKSTADQYQDGTGWNF